jgi:hypothetical protein
MAKRKIRKGDEVEFIGDDPPAGVQTGDQGEALGNETKIGTVRCEFNGQAYLMDAADLEIVET